MNDSLSAIPTPDLQSLRLKKSLTFLIAGLMFLISVSDNSTAAEKARRPNIVVIMADDLGYECLEVNGGTSYQTPRLNQLAATGMRFTHCYSQPICTPSRVQLMTGRYNQRNYVRFGLLHPDQTTFGQVLKANGYRTFIAGKWQLEGGLKGPQHFGFDEYALWQLTRRPSRYPNPGLEINGQEIDFPEKYGPDIVSDAICEFISRPSDQPFLVYYPMILPHWPFEPTPDSEDWDPQSPGMLKGSQKYPKYFVDMVAYTDKMVGKIVDKLDELKLRENTIVLFTGDNGTAQSVVSMMGDREFPGGKGKPTDAGMHVPMIASWPGTIKPGQVTDRLVDFTDYFPTLLDLAKVDHQQVADVGLDGLSFLPTLTNQSGPEKEYIYCWYARNGGPDGAEFVQNHTFKLYRDGQFFNIADDPLEKQALTKPFSSEAAQQHQQLKKYLSKYDNSRVMLPDPTAEKQKKKPASKANSNKKNKS